MEEYDVVISGGGPTGSIIGAILAKKGFKVVIIEKQKHPRWKPCGEGISEEGINLFKTHGIYEPIKNLLWGIDKLSFYIIHKEFFSKKYKTSVAYTCDRSHFDYALFEYAKKSGAETRENETVINFLKIKDKEIHIKTSKYEYRSKLILGADGIYSIVGKKLFRPWKKDEITSCHVARYKKLNLENFNSREMEYYLINGDYGWIFPKQMKNYLILNIGWGSITNNSLESFSKFIKFLEKHKRVKLAGKEIDSKIWSHAIPIKGTSRGTYSNNCLLLGDAGGFVNPLTGAGLKYGAMSTFHAAEIANKYLNNEIESLSKYEEKWKEDIGRIFNKSLKTREILYNSDPKYLYNFYGKNSFLKEKLFEPFLSKKY